MGSRDLLHNERLVKIEVPHSKYKEGIVGILTSPPSSYGPDPFVKGYSPATHKAVLLLHGQSGHKSYCYLKMLAEKLAAELGIYSLRIDFRGCGDSEPNADEKSGRVVEQDVEDIGLAVDFLQSGSNCAGIKFTITAIIGHSRGSVAMFEWAMKQQQKLLAGDSDYTIVNSLINCGGRFESEKVIEKYDESDQNWRLNGGSKLVSYRYGEYQSIWHPSEEFLKLSQCDMTQVSTLSKDISVLSIYGLEDDIIPLQDSAHFANHLGSRHKLEFIPGADHNYYGKIPIIDEHHAKKHNKENLPLNSRKHINYNCKVTDIITDYLKSENEFQRFFEKSQNISNVCRWKYVEGICNFRDIGGWRIKDESGSYVRPGIGFRCASTGRVTEKGKETIKKMGITAIFDFRSLDECQKDGVPEIEGVNRYHVPVFADVNFSPEAIALRYGNLLTSWWTYKNVYRESLQNGTSAFRKVFEFIRDHPNEGFVFHCTAGKDRTGLMCMLILLFLGVDKDTVAREYELTSIGLRPDFEKIRSKFVINIEKIKHKLGKLDNDFEVKISKGRPNWTIEKDGFSNLISSRYEAMLATIEILTDEFGGIDNYMSAYLKFSNDDLKIIKTNLVVKNIQPDHIWVHRCTNAYKI